VEKNPIYWVYFGEEFQYHVKSEKSSSDAAVLYAKVYIINLLICLLIKLFKFVINVINNFLK
jgi:hypothetical protein